jgi:hypothetical protein
MLEELRVLVGTWETEATHPATGPLVVSGRAKFEWLEGERFLILRSTMEHPDFPDAISVLGAFEDGRLEMHYFDSRGVARIYTWSFEGDIWRIERAAPGFSQRFAGTLAPDGRTIEGLWELSRDGTTWDDDLKITYRRAD